MEFTYNAYRNLLQNLFEENYSFSNYQNWNSFKRCIILRHDIDYDINKAIKMAELEKEEGVKSTYFVLLTSNFYNVFSKESLKGLQAILDWGHSIGLHFDEVKYPEAECNNEKISELIQQEAYILGLSLGIKIDVVSMHRPSKGLLESNLEIPGIINSYSQTFFKNFKYLSDSRRRWREPVEEIVKSNEFNKIHLLTHAFWYYDNEFDIHDTVTSFVNDGNRCRYNWLLDNITDLKSIMSIDELK